MKGLSTMHSRRSAAAAITAGAGRRGVLFAVLLALVGAALVVAPLPAQAACTGNAVVCENQKQGTSIDDWDLNGSGDSTIQGFATQISVNAGSAVQFKIDTSASAYSIMIYRLGWYQGKGAREITTIAPSVTLPQPQPACATNPATEIYDCGTWKVSASWDIPADAISGVYIARLVRTDNGGDSRIPFIVRNDGNTSKVLFQTSDTTWQAYNTYGGSNFYWGGPNGRAYKLSYNRPFNTPDRDYVFSNEYPMIRYLEQNGFDVSYVSGLDTSVDPALITKHKVYMSVGHDEYWSKPQRDNVLAARNAGVSLAFFGGNNMYWKTRWEPSQDGNNTANRTIVCYKVTWDNAQTDPVEPTPTWRDPRFGDLGHGPENSLMGTLYKANSVDLAIKVNADEGKLRLWRNTSLASLGTDDTATLAAHTVGYESDEDLDNGFRPAGLVRMSTTVGPTSEYLTDFGNTVVPGTTTHHVTQYRASSGALVFSSGTIQWAWGLDSNHSGTDIQPADPRIRQATLNLLTDMGADAATTAEDLVPTTKSDDTTAPTSTITQPAGGSISAGSLVTVKGTASDVGGRVGGVEVSVDGGATFHPASGRESYTYTDILTGTDAGAIQVRAIDDSGNIQTTTTKLAVMADCPCTIFGAMTPTTTAVSDGTPLTVGTKFTAAQDGFISGIRFYKGAGNTGEHVGTLYAASGQALAQATFGNESAEGWQTVTFPAAVPITAGTTYVAAYFAPTGHYAADSYFFAYQGYGSGKLTALGGDSNPNGVFAFNNSFPTQSYRQTNYYVDAIWNATDTTPLGVSALKPLSGETSVPGDATMSATFARPVQSSSVNFVVLTPTNTPVPGSTSYSSASKTATFTPTQPLAPSTTYTVSVTADPSSGAGMAAPQQWSFTTAKPPTSQGDCPCTLFDDADHPTNAPADDTAPVKVGVAFKTTSAGTISGIRFYKAAGNTGAHTIALWSGSGAQLATAAVSNESAAGWQEASFGSPVAISANTTYIASYLAPNGKYSATSGGLSASIDRTPLVSLAGGGRYTYGSGAPLSASSANYWVDPIFSAAPNQAPTVVATSPGNNATSVPVSARVTVTFDSPVQPGSATVTVKRASDGAAVAGTASSETSGTTVTFLPSGAFDPGTKYSVTVSGARSSGGTPMAQPATREFTTSGAEACPCSLMETTTEPSLSDGGDAGAITLGLSFTPSVNGYVKGIRYFRDAANTGTHTGKLWSSSGDELASVTFDDSGDGWQQATFSSAVPVTAGTTYVASYYAPNGHYSAASGQFAQPMVNVPLSSVGAGGVYHYGNGFPNQSYLSTNYFVDVVFTTRNDDPPSVSATTPTDGASSAAVDVKPSATFTQAIDTGSLSFTVKDPNGQLVAGQTAYDGDGKKATFTPAAPLAADTTYTATVVASSAGGVAMTGPKTWSFTTVDSVPPVVIATTPAADASTVQPSSSIQATFAKAINASSLSMTLRQGSQSVAGAATYDAATRTATFKPTASLAGGTTFTASVDASSVDGTQMAAPRIWNFATVDTAPVSVTSTAPASGADNVSSGSTVTATFDKAITQSTLAFSLKTAAGATVNGTTTYSATDRMATFTPSTALAGSTTYNASVSASSAAGVAMTSAKTWSFTIADNAPPTVATKTPAANATGIAATTKVTAVFDKAITASTLALSLRTAAGATVAGSTSYDAATRTATFTPTAALTSSTSYTASARASSAAGVAMSAATTWSFSTAAQTFSLFTTSQAPTAANVSNGTALPYTVGVRFTSSRAGKATAIRYYAGSTNTGTTVSLWNTSGSRLATATTTGTGTGWRTATFTTPVNITAGTTYVASYYAPAGRFASTSGTFSSTYTSGPLTVATSGSRSILGNSFPTGTSTANYWVDVLVSI